MPPGGHGTTSGPWPPGAGGTPPRWAGGWATRTRARPRGTVRPELAAVLGGRPDGRDGRAGAGRLADHGSRSRRRLRASTGPTPATVLDYLREVDEDVRSALVVGHNPTCPDLDLGPAGRRVDHEP